MLYSLANSVIRYTIYMFTAILILAIHNSLCVPKDNAILPSILSVYIAIAS